MSVIFFCSGGDADSIDGSWLESNGIRVPHGYNSSSNSNSSSVSHISSSSSDKMTVESGDLEADADSMSCRQSGLSSSDQMGNDGVKLVGCFLHFDYIYSLFLHFIGIDAHVFVSS